jgi:FkbH-like protein
VDRKRVEELCQADRVREALAELRLLVEREPTQANIRFGLSRFEGLLEDPPDDFVPVRLGILSTFTMDPFVPYLRLWGLINRLVIDVYTAPFNQIDQEILDDGSGLWRLQPTTIAIAADGADLAPSLYGGYLRLERPGGSERLVDEVLEQVHTWISSVRGHARTPVLIHNFAPPPYPALGCLDASSRGGQAETIHRVNHKLADLARESDSVYAVDIAQLISRIGWRQWHDPRLWHLARMRLSNSALPHLADTYIAFLRPIAGRQRKCLVLDLDGTLWGGVIGEEGLNGISLSSDHPGSAFREVQEAALELHDRGVILAINSKNNPADALEAIDQHPEMLLRREHFAAMRINWEEKASNLLSIAEELNIGTDQMVFLDDNPAERAWVRSQLPEVLVPEMPSDPAEYAGTLRSLRDFDALGWSEEDRGRTRMYRAESSRRALRKETVTLEEFYENLEMRVRIFTDPASIVPRVAQLTQRTNQFNLTTRRYTESEIRDFMASDSAEVLALRLEDRFGDSGVVGVAVTTRGEPAWTIDSFLLSCRVLGRTVEDLLLAFIAKRAREVGAERLCGIYIPTRKNQAAAGFYEKHGFIRDSSSGPDEHRWTLDLRDRCPAFPPWIDLQLELGDG